MKSIYEQALGDKFRLLHPRIQERFGFSSRDNRACVGTGTMNKIWHGPLYTMPFLYVGSWRRIMFPERGENVPFTIRNYAYVDDHGRETVTWIRNFSTPTPRRFDAYMIFSPQRNRIVDYLGTHQHRPSTSIYPSINEEGFAFGPGSNVSMRVGLDLVFLYFFPESRTCASGTKKAINAFTLR
jgi:hypothetical protein